MLAEGLLALAALAGRTVVAAAGTDVWETARSGFAGLLGRGHAEQTRLAEQRLDETRKQLTTAAPADVGRIGTALAERWAGRWEDLLEENPDAEADLRALVLQTHAALRAGAVPGDPAAVPDDVNRVRLAPRPVSLAGRELLLAELDARLADGGPRPRIVTLCGPAGSGKTSMAVEYAHRLLARAGVVWQLAAGEVTVLAAGFAELAGQLGARDPLDRVDPVESVHDALATFPGQWLLLFDDAPDMASIEAFVPPAGPGRVLITSRHQSWPDGQTLDVPVLGAELGAEFLVDRTGDPDWQAARELAGPRELAGLPLALEQAAAYMRATGESLAGYLASFRPRRTSLSLRDEAAGYPGTVAVTCALAAERLEQVRPDAVALLRLLACCGPGPIPVRLLLRLRPGLPEQLAPQVASSLVPLLQDQAATAGALAALRRYSLISPAAGGSVSVHRLVRAVIVDQMPAELGAAWRQATAVVIEAAIPASPEQPQTWTDYAALLPHAQAVLGPERRGMAQIAAYLGQSGSQAAAGELQRRIIQARARTLGPEHRDTLGSRNELAYWTGQAGDAAAARDQFAALLPVVERVLGPADSDVLATRASLAYWTGQAGDAAAARDQFAALLPVVERALGPEHPDTLISRHNLANFTGYANDAAGARDQFAALLPVVERVSGPDHPDTLAVRFNLAYWTGQAGDAAAARDQFAALLPVRERILGPEHPDTLAARKELGYWTGRAGDAAAARDQFAALLPVRERILGPEHPSTLATRASLAYWTAQAGDAVGARDQYAALLPVRERILGPEHPDTLATRHQLAYWTGRAGDAAAARDQFAALLPVRERVLGPEHPDTVATRTSLAHLTGESPAGQARRGWFRRR
jgi:RecA/RadA recombinase